MLIPISALFSLFAPPQDFKHVEITGAAPSVKTTFLMENRSGFVPSMNYSLEGLTLPFPLYVKHMKTHFSKNPQNRLHDLGTITLNNSKARLFEIDTENNWGRIKLMQAHLPLDGKIHVITACALKEEFDNLRSEFLKSMRTFQITESAKEPWAHELH